MHWSVFILQSTVTVQKLTNLHMYSYIHFALMYSFTNNHICEIYKLFINLCSCNKLVLKFMSFGEGHCPISVFI